MATYPERKGRGKRWLAIWINPAGRERSQAFDEKGDAEKHTTKMEADISRGAYIDPAKARITVEEWCVTWSIPVLASLIAECSAQISAYGRGETLLTGADGRQLPPWAIKTVQARLRHASAKITLDTYGHIWPDRDEPTRAAVDAVLTAYRTEQGRNKADAL